MTGIGFGVGTPFGGISEEWTPASLANLVGWWDASDTGSISDTGGLVDQINDLSGNGYHLTSSGVNRPTTGTRTKNSLNVLDHDGNDYLSRAAMPVAASQSVIIMGVAIVDSTTGSTGALWSANSAGEDWQFDANVAGGGFEGRIVSTTSMAVNTGSSGVNAVGEWRIWSTIFDWTGDFDATPGARVYKDDSELVSDISIGVQMDTTQEFIAMANRGKSAFANGAWGEIIWNDGSDLQDWTSMYNYLLNKWGAMG